MKKKNLIVLVVFLASAVTGFQSIGAAQLHTNKELPIVNSIVPPPHPGSLANKTKVGVDTNHNGVRDEVEIYIFKKYSEDKEKLKIIMEFTKKKQALLSISLEDEAAKKYNLGADSAFCLSKKLSVNMSEAERINYDLSTQVFNTWERQAHFQDIMVKSEQFDTPLENPNCD
jgi:hypothetical protein